MHFIFYRESRKYY